MSARLARSSTTGVAHLLRLVARLDRICFPLWLVGLGGTVVGSVLAVPPLYDTPAKVAGYAGSVGSSPVNHLVSGRQAGLDTVGGIVANEVSQVAQLGTCLMVVFLVVRHTRSEEDAGRAELVRSAVVGRHAATLAALAYGVAASVLVGVVATVSMVAAGLDVHGTLAYGTGLALLGATYAAATLVAVQVSSSARGALGIAGTAVAIGYLARGVGAMQDNALVWASPFGWVQQMNAFGDERWWPALLPVSAAVLLLALAGGLAAGRDVGSGILPTRPGRPRATRWLGTPVALVLRVQQGLAVGWAIGLAVLGLLYGVVVPSIPDLVAANPDMAGVVGAPGATGDDLVDAFLSSIHAMMATVSCGFVVSSVLRLRAEEASGRADVVLAAPVRRTTWVAAFTAVAFLGVTAITLLAGLGLGAGYATAADEWSRLAPQAVGQLARLPGTLVVGAFAVALCGLMPRLAGAAWALVALVALEQLLGKQLGLPDALAGLSPYWHLPAVPVEDLSVVSSVVLLGVAGALVLAGAWGHRRRDALNG